MKIKLEEMAMPQSEAIDRCESLGELFIAHFKKILYEDKSPEEIHHHAKEMQAWYNKVSNIVLKGQKHKINTHHIYDWFITCGSLSSFLFDNEEDALLYENFANVLLDNGDVLEALKEVGLY